MKRTHVTTIIILVSLSVVWLSTNTLAAPAKIVIGHPACLSGSYAKAGEQALGGVKGCIDWVNSVHGGVTVSGKKVPLDYKYYDCESKKESVT